MQYRYRRARNLLPGTFALWSYPTGDDLVYWQLGPGRLIKGSGGLPNGLFQTSDWNTEKVVKMRLRGKDEWEWGGGDSRRKYLSLLPRSRVFYSILTDEDQTWPLTYSSFGTHSHSIYWAFNSPYPDLPKKKSVSKLKIRLRICRWPK